MLNTKISQSEPKILLQQQNHQKIKDAHGDVRQDKRGKTTARSVTAQPARSDIPHRAVRVNTKNTRSQNTVVLENSNVEKLASNQYLLVQSRSKEDRYDINDASAGEVYAILVPASTVSVLQSSRRREHRPSVVDRQTQTHRTATLHGMRPGILRTGGDPDGPEHTPRSNCDPAPEMSTVGCL